MGCFFFFFPSLFFLLSGCVLEILSSSGRKMEFPTSVPESSSVCAISGADRRKQAGAECSQSFISYSSEEETCQEKIKKWPPTFFFFRLKPVTLKHVLFTFFLVCLFCVKCGGLCFYFFFCNSRSLRRDKIWNVLPLYTLVMANSLAYMAKAKLILNKETLGETLVLLFLVLLLLIQAFHIYLPFKVHVQNLSCFSTQQSPHNSSSSCCNSCNSPERRWKQNRKRCSCFSRAKQGTGADKADCVVWDAPGNVGTKPALLNSCLCFLLIVSVR